MIPPTPEPPRYYELSLPRRLIEFKVQQRMIEAELAKPGGKVVMAVDIVGDDPKYHGESREEMDRHHHARLAARR